MSVALWTIDTLSPLCAHESEDVREWAIERLGRLGDVAALPRIVSALDDGSPSVVGAAVTAIERLGDIAPTEVIRAPLQGVIRREGNHWGVKSSARTLLLKRHDPDTVEATLAQLLNGGAGRAAWRQVAREEPARLWDVMQREVPSASEEVRAAALTVQPMVCPVEALPTIFAGMASLDDEARAELMTACLWRCGADQCAAAERPTRDDWAEIIDDIGWAYIDERDEALVDAWLSVEAFRAPLDAFDADRWRDVIAWCASRVAAVGGDDPRAAWSRALVGCLVEAGEPTELDARAAISLAIGAGTRAIERERPFSERSLAEQFARACRSPGASEGSQRSVVTQRWRALDLDDRGRAALSERLVNIIADGDALSGTNAFEIASTLPGLRLDASLLDVDLDTDDAYVEALARCLEAQPESLRALAPAVLDEGTAFTRHMVLGALKVQNERWAVELLASRFDALLRGESGEFVLDAARDLGDPALLASVVAAWRPGEALPATTALHIARVNGLERTLPDALRREAAQEGQRMAALLRDVTDRGGVDAMLNKFNDGPLSVELVCNRCGRSAHYQPGRALLHPDLEACKREGWDGVTFERIIVCKFCGAEDDYTLASTAMLAIVAGALGAMLKGEKLSAEALDSARMTVGVPGLSDGTRIRRASDGLRHWRAKIDKNPHDGEAWLRLGNLLRDNDRTDEAIAAYRRSIAERPHQVDAPGALLVLLSDAGRHDEGSELPELILRELPKSRVAPEERMGLADLVVAALRGAVSAGQPLGLNAGWEGGVVSGKNAMRVSSLDLRRVTRWDRLTAFIAQPSVLMLALKIAAPDDARTQLEMLIEGSAPLGLAPSAFGGFGRDTSAAQQPVVRSTAKIGRNDLCHCGSGKKFKKCHGA